MTEFNPAIYKTYNLETDKEELQFKHLEEIPAQYRDKFKRAPQGGFVHMEAVENIDKAYWMAKMQKDNMPKTGSKNLSKKAQREIDRLLEITSDVYELGKRKAKKEKQTK